MDDAAAARATAEAARPKDVLIVGAGPAGLAVAIAAREAGLEYELVEKGVLVNSIYHFPRNMIFFTTAELLEIGGLPFVTPYEKPTQAEGLKYYRRVADACELRIALDEEVTKVRPAVPPDAPGFVVETRVVEIQEDHVRVEDAAGRHALPADAVFLLTGYHPDCALLMGAGVRVDPATLVPEHDHETLETNVRGLYLAGAIVSGRETGRIFIENGRFHGRAILDSTRSRL